MSVAELRKLLERYEERPESYALEFRMSVGLIVIGRLRELEWTQRQLAAAVGVTEQLISRLLNGDHNWTSESVGRVMHALGVRIRARRVAKGDVTRNDVFILHSVDGSMTSHGIGYLASEVYEQDTAKTDGKFTFQAEAAASG